MQHTVYLDHDNRYLHILYKSSAHRGYSSALDEFRIIFGLLNDRLPSTGQDLAVVVVGASRFAAGLVVSIQVSKAVAAGLI